MPGWGAGSFENEDAQNFLGRLNSVSIDDLRSILSRAADQSDYLEAPDAATAVVAGEVVASARGKGAPLSVPREIADWISQSPVALPSDFDDLARRAVERVRTNSELKDLWLEAEGLNEWSAALRDLEARLRP
jgi:hypothetical protein